MFWFNDKVDVYVLAPVASGWEKGVAALRAHLGLALLRQPASRSSPSTISCRAR